MSALLPLIHYHSREHRGDAFFFSGGIMPPGHELRRARARIEEKNEEEVVGLARSRRGFCFFGCGVPDLRLCDYAVFFT